jgi:predicted NBD/HSP70 family sugar kinase
MARRARTPRPGTPRLLRELNDRAALELLLTGGPMTRAQLGGHTGLSKVTASQLLTRLQERGLVGVAGKQAGGGRGPNAVLYAVVASAAYVAALDIEPEGVRAGVADITGRIVGQVTADPVRARAGADGPVSPADGPVSPADGPVSPADGPVSPADQAALVHRTVSSVCRSAGVTLSQLRAFVIGSPGVVDPRTGDIEFAVDLPAWHSGLLTMLRARLGGPVTLENDVNLAAMAERVTGAAKGLDDFALIWLGRGLGLATVLGGRLYRGSSGAAGEIGYLPVPGAGLPDDISRPRTGAFRSLAGANVVVELAAAYGFGGQPAGRCVAAAVAAAGDPAGRAESARAFLAELASRIAVGVASVCVVLDPGLAVLAGPVGRAGGPLLAELVAERVARICPSRPQVVTTGVESSPVLRGAMLLALDQARAELLDSVAES